MQITALACGEYYLFAATVDGRLFMRSASRLFAEWVEVDTPQPRPPSTHLPPDPSEEERIY